MWLSKADATTISELRQALSEAHRTILEQAKLIASMKQQRFEEPPKTMEPLPDPLVPSIRKAIAERSDPGSRDRRLLEAEALRMLEAGSGSDEVMASILAGENPE